MKKILVTGSTGQIGSDLVEKLRSIYGDSNVISSARSENEDSYYERLDVVDGKKFYEIVKKHNIDTILHLAAILSAVGEKRPQQLWNVNVNGLYNALEISRELNCSLFVPSSIGAFGPQTPKVNTPQTTIQRPTTIYGVSKVTGEILCDYYYNKFGVDTRGVRFPGLISHKALPGGGTTDYAVHIYYEAIRNKKYTSFISEDVYMDMMYMPDAVDSIIDLMEADSNNLVDRNAFNVSGMSFSPKEISKSIKKIIPEFELSYDIDPVRDSIARSWPDSLDTSEAQKQWGFKPKYDLDSMTKDMIDNIRLKESL